MRANIIIKAKQNGATIEGVNMRGDFVETDTPSGMYKSNTNITLTAIDIGGFTFDGWSNGA